jgi:hypothetical protein
LAAGLASLGACGGEDSKVPPVLSAPVASAAPIRAYPHWWPTQPYSGEVSERTLGLDTVRGRFVEDDFLGLISYGTLDEEGQRVGYWIECDERRVARRVVHYAHGWEHGPCMTFDEHGRLRARGELVHVDGHGVLRTGPWEYWLEDGTVDAIHTGKYDAGQRVSDL